MKIKILLFVLLSAVMLPLISYAEISAVTKNGKPIVLFPDGTWQFKIDKDENANSTLVYTDNHIRISIDGMKFQKKVAENNSFNTFESKAAQLKAQAKASRQGNYDTNFQTLCVFDVTNLSKNKLLNPKTHTVWGYEDKLAFGGLSVSGFNLFDNFGNNLIVSDLYPSYMGSDTRIQLGETVRFFLRAKNRPVNTANSITLKINKSVFHTNSSINFSIPKKKLTTHK